MKKKNGFTLIELLAVIIILGILMIIAIPAVTRYINDSRKSAYIDTAKEVIGAARNKVNDDLKLFDTDTTYYIDSECIATENALKSPYGEFEKAYVVVTYSGTNYDYYWTSIDETGTGVPKITRLDKLNEDSIKSDLKVEDIPNDLGIDGRTKYMIIDKATTNCGKGTSQNVSKNISGETGEELVYICKKATTLHTATCERDDSAGCKKVVGDDNTITYGSIPNGSPRVGDAYDCKLTEDGDYTERFYYVSPYYDTNTLSFDNSYAVLIYYKNVQTSSSGNLVTTYSSDGISYNGPVTASRYLPLTSSWSNVSLKNTTRAILGEYQDSHNLTIVNSHELPTDYSFEGKAARLLTGQELMRACNIPKMNNDYDLKNCTFLFENTKFEKESLSPSGILLETVGNSDNLSWSTYYYSISLSLNNANRTMGLKPVIEIPISALEK